MLVSVVMIALVKQISFTCKMFVKLSDYKLYIVPICSIARCVSSISYTCTTAVCMRRSCI